MCLPSYLTKLGISYVVCTTDWKINYIIELKNFVMQPMRRVICPEANILHCTVICYLKQTAFRGEASFKKSLPGVVGRRLHSV